MHESTILLNLYSSAGLSKALCASLGYLVWYLI